MYPLEIGIKTVILSLNCLIPANDQGIHAEKLKVDEQNQSIQSLGSY
jgi:hypothetical protein